MVSPISTLFRLSSARVVVNRWKNCRCIWAYQPSLCRPRQVEEHVRDNSSIPTRSRKNLFFADPGKRRFFSAETLEGSRKKSWNEEDVKDYIAYTCSMVVVFGPLIGCVFGGLKGFEETLEESFEEFRSMLLEPGLVSNIVVYGRFAIVNVKTSSIEGLRFRRYQPTKDGLYTLEIADPDSFKSKLGKAQETLGVLPLHYIPVTVVTAN